MAKSGDVLFPGDYDKRSFFSDIGLPDKNKLTTHNSLMKSKKYRQASVFAEASGHEYYGAYLFNALEGRVNRIGDYLKKEEAIEIRPYFQEEEPTQNLYNNLTWISSQTF